MRTTERADFGMGAGTASATLHLSAVVAIGAAGLALLSLAALHVLRPDLAPSSHMISEYAVGTHGWVMGTCFLAFAVSSASLLLALASHVRTLPGRVGLAFLMLATVGLAMAARFPMDPISIPPEAASFSGRMHGVSFMMGVPGEILAVLLLSLALRKQGPWAARPLLLLAVVIWLSLGVMIVSLIVAMQQPVMAGSGIFGIPNRVFMGTYAVWLMSVAWPMTRSHEGPLARRR